MASNSVTPQQKKGFSEILSWGVINFHKLREDNKVKIFLKVYDKVEADKLELSMPLSEAVKAARLRAAGRLG